MELNFLLICHIIKIISYPIIVQEIHQRQK